MKEDNQLKEYFKRRLGELGDASNLGASRDARSPFEVPSFEEMFKPEELIAPKPRLRLWPVFAAVSSVAAAILLLFTFVFDASEKALPADDFASSDSVTEEVSLADAPLAGLASHSQSPVAQINTSQPTATGISQPTKAKVSQPVGAIRPEDLFAAVDFDSETRELELVAKFGMASESKAEPESETETAPETEPELAPSPEPETELEPAKFERSIEEAYAEARQQKTKPFSRRISYGARFTQNSSLLASVTPSGTTASPMSNLVSSYGNVGLRSATPKNEWKTPQNLTKSQLMAYKPMYRYPLSLGVEVGIPLSPLFALHTGLTYTYLSSEISGGQENASLWTLQQALHYVGIPLSLAINIFDSDRWRFYAALGGGLEKGICGTQRSMVRKSFDDAYSTEITRQAVQGVQPYAAASLGLSYTFSSDWALYLAPGLNYYFDTDQPMSIRTKKPLNLNVSAGFRRSF
ncbi:MAG: hypothetical protein IJ280_01900 [Bacteroidales bacterium]|nr:hypothetical protein [Bacteroidales bacterium]